MNPICTWIATILASALVAGCGGGAATEPASPTTSPNVATAAAPAVPSAAAAAADLVAVGGTSTQTPTTTAASGPTPRALPSRRVTVASEAQLQTALADANASGGDVTLVLKSGTYALSRTLQVSAPNIALVSETGNRDDVTIRGDAMSASAVIKNVVRVTGKGFQLRGITLERAGWHLLQIVGEADADDAIIRDCAMRDAWEQMLKVSYDASRPDVGADRGLVENCVFEYTAGIGPQYYIGGVDAHQVSDWIIRGNVFRYIASPSRSVAEHAVHFWSNSRNTIVERNAIVDCDRGIGFGLGDRGHEGGVIRNNFIHHTANTHPFADAGIILENSANTAVYNNTILMEHAYPRAIEYRFARTSGGAIRNNLTNRAVAARDGGTATVGSNVVTATRSMFQLRFPGDLTLTAAHPGVVDAGVAIDGLVDDVTGERRPKGAGIDIGADEL